MHVHDEIMSEVFAAGPFVETEIPLLLDCLRGGAIEDGLAVLGRKLAGVIVDQILF